LLAADPKLPSDEINSLRIDRGQPIVSIRGRRKRRWVVWLALGLLLALGFFAKLRWYPGAIAVEFGTVTTAYPTQTVTLFNATGYVVPQRKADVASKATGRLESLRVQEGQRVKRGDVLGTLENQDLIAQQGRAQANVQVANASLAQARAELREAELVLKRSENLLKRRFVTQETHDTAIARHAKAHAGVESAQANIAAAEAALNETKVAVEYTLIRAPFDGVILAKRANVGDIVAPFAAAIQSKGAVASMADMSTLEVEADVSESNLAKVQVGQSCEILLDAVPEVRMRGEVNRIVPTVDRSKATILVKVSFTDKDPRVLPEMSARVAFLSRPLGEQENTPFVVVPEKALVSREGQDRVFVISDDQVSEVPIEKGAKLSDTIEVKRGLKGGEKVVINPSEKLQDGSKVVLPKT
jgi:RND family efflux transporter MFP subunit